MSHVALLRAGRVAMLARIADLEAAGLPLTMRGIGELADRRWAASEPARDPRGHAASVPR